MSIAPLHGTFEIIMNNSLEFSATLMSNIKFHNVFIIVLLNMQMWNKLFRQTTVYSNGLSQGRPYAEAEKRRECFRFYRQIFEL